MSGLISTNKSWWPEYFGSPTHGYIEQDFTPEELADFTLRRQYLWESETATHKEALAKEREFIRSLQSNDPNIGYNRHPKLANVV
jgi:hypothetical protein